jgi:hypothetical protein
LAGKLPIITAIDFRCGEFHLGPTDLEARAVEVSFQDYQPSGFTIVRGNHPGEYQFQIDGVFYDTGLLEGSDGAVMFPPHRVQDVGERLRANNLPIEDFDDGDEFIAFLRRLFGQLRAEGDLTRVRHELENLRVTYFRRDSAQQLFSADYFGRRIAV